MQKISALQIDCASENIAKIQLLKKKLLSTHNLDQGLLQQYLDEESLYIKQMPRVSPKFDPLLGCLQRFPSGRRRIVLYPIRIQNCFEFILTGAAPKR